MRKAARRIVEKLRLHGHEAFLAGGWVRDFLLRRQPSDIDIATSALPEEVQRLFPKSTAVGAGFGVVQVRMYGHTYEVTTFRSDGAYLDGRHPSSVSFGGPKQDALRRDFTINGLFFDPLSERVIDYVRGRADISRRLIQTIGKPEDRFAEDKLRMMRAIRFACNLAFEIAPATWEALEHSAGEILQVSWERIRDELLKILIGPAPDRGLDLLHRSGLLRHILPEVEAMVEVQQPPEFHPEGDVFTHTSRALALLRKPPAILALGTLLHDVGKPPTFTVRERIRFDGHVEIGARMAEEICRRLRLSNEEIAGVVDLVLLHLHFMNVKEMRTSTLRRFLRKANIEQHLELHRVDCLSSHRDLEYYHFCREKLLQYRNEPPSPPPLISGRDLIELGYKPGPIFGEILEQIENLELEGILRTHEEALAYVKQNYPMYPEPEKTQID
jgi:putative nucleotidyltransferase with HDIG domain